MSLHGNRGHAVLRVHVAEDACPVGLHVTCGAPEIRYVLDPGATSGEIAAGRCSLGNVVPCVVVALVKALAEENPGSVVPRPAGTATVVNLEVVNPPGAVSGGINVLMLIGARALLTGKLPLGRVCRKRVP